MLPINILIFYFTLYDKLRPNGPALSCGADKYRHAINETSLTTKVLSFAPDLCSAMLIAPGWQPSA
jgi:hypothetical protein